MPPAPMTKPQADAIYGLLLVADFTSILGCITVLVGFARLQLLRNHLTRIIACFCVTSSIKDTIAVILTLEDHAYKVNKFACYLYAASINFGSFSCWMWTFCLALSIYLVISRVSINYMKFEIYYAIASWGLPLISTIIMLSSNIISNQGSWCWIQSTSQAYRFGLFYIPFFIIFVGSAVLVGMTSHYTYVVMKGHATKTTNHSIYQFKLVNYIIIFLICWVMAVVNRILNAFDIYPYACNLLHTYLSVSHGFFASIVFIYNNPIMWRYFCCQILRVCVFIGFGHQAHDRFSREINDIGNDLTRRGSKPPARRSTGGTRSLTPNQPTNTSISMSNITHLSTLQTDTSSSSSTPTTSRSGPSNTISSHSSNMASGIDDHQTDEDGDDSDIINV